MKKFFRFISDALLWAGFIALTVCAMFIGAIIALYICSYINPLKF